MTVAIVAAIPAVVFGGLAWSLCRAAGRADQAVEAIQDSYRIIESDWQRWWDQ